MIAELSAEKCDQLVDEFKRDERKKLLWFIFDAYSDRDPVGAVRVFINHPDLMEADPNNPTTYTLQASIAKKLSNDPVKASIWLEGNRDKLGNSIIAPIASKAIISGFAKTSPDQALEMASKLGFSASETASILGEAPKSAEERSALLGALRGNTNDPKMLKGVLTAMAPNLLLGGTDQALEWIESNQLTPAEAAAILAGTDNSGLKRQSMSTDPDSNIPQDTGRWLSTLGDLAGEAGQPQVERVMSAWCAADYQAAGEWLLTRKDGPATRAAIAAFAETAAPYDPEGASHWVETLPRDARRKAAAGKVVQEWLAIDPAAARNFAVREGLRPGF